MDPKSDNNYLIYELVGGGSLADLLKSENGRVRLPYLQRLRIMSETLRALNFLHTGGCAGLEIHHCDIKSSNICFTDNWSSKLIGFGLSRMEHMEELSTDGKSTVRSYDSIQTNGYICRSYWNGKRPYVSACDIYSFGIVMIELLTGTLNRESSAYPGDFYNHFIVSTNDVAVPDNVQKLLTRCDELVVWNERDLQTLCQLALQCLSLDVQERPTAKLLLFEISKMLLRGEIGELPEEYTNIHMTSGTNCVTTLLCSVCNEQTDLNIHCQNNHILCNQCITQEAVMASRIGSGYVKCPMMQCGCTFDIQNDLYAIVPQDVYNRTIAEGRILETLDRIFQKQECIVSDISQVRKGVNRGLQALARLSPNISTSCPKLVWIKPGSSVGSNGPATKPSSWKHLTEISVEVYFICEHSYTSVAKPIQLTVKKQWLRHIAPALKLTLVVLKLTTTFAGLPFPLSNFVNISEQVDIANEFVDSLLDANESNLINESEQFFTNGTKQVDHEQIKTLTGPAYDYLADGVRSGGQSNLQEEMTPVLDEHGAIIWVKHEYSHKYIFS